MILVRVLVGVCAFVLFGVVLCGVRWRIIDLGYKRASLLERRRCLKNRIRTAQTALQRLLRPERLRRIAEKAELKKAAGDPK